MIFIDSNIWCYYFDRSAEEHDAVSNYLERVLKGEKALMNTVVVMEIAHYLIKNLGPVRGGENIDKLLSLPFKIVDFGFDDMEESINVLKTYTTQGIGGRDATVIASMIEEDVNKIVTHDKAFRKVDKVEVIDPVEEF